MSEALGVALDEWEVETGLTHRQGPTGTLEFLVRWKGFGPAHDTWEPWHHFFPQYKVLVAKY